MKKGTTNNPNGRPPGTPNKSTSEMRDFIQAFIEHNSEAMQAEFEKLEGPDKFRVIEKLLPYVLARQNAVTISPQEDTKKSLPYWITDPPIHD